MREVLIAAHSASMHGVYIWPAYMQETVMESFSLETFHSRRLPRKPSSSCRTSFGSASSRISSRLLALSGSEMEFTAFLDRIDQYLLSPRGMLRTNIYRGTRIAGTFHRIG